MSSSVILITPPDDVFIDADRMLCIDLTPEQTSLVSSSLTKLDFENQLIVYIWKLNDPIEWIFDKKDKCSIIFLNADSKDNYLVGYFAGNPKCHYFGNLKNLSKVNHREIYGQESVDSIFNNFFNI
jgi:hypothetical protein